MSSIVTFYSYKGGVGRTMALANIAVVLAKRGLRILMVDFDLEAPGLHYYFKDYTNENKNTKGILELLTERPKRESWYSSHIVNVNIPNATELSLIKGGRYDETYTKRVLDFNWSSFFRELNGGEFLENLRDEWLSEFDLIFIDSRTGITDSGGVCTIQLPDILVPVIIANEQTLEGTRDIINRIQRARDNYDWDRPPATILPLISRFDSRAEFKDSQEWLSFSSQKLNEAYSDWLPKKVDRLKILERTKIPHVAKFSFGENLAVIHGSTTDPEGLGYAYETIAALLFHDFKNAESIITERDSYVREMEVGSIQDFEWDVFLSYASPDKEYAQKLISSLEKKNLRIWTDLQIKVGQDIEKSFISAIKRSRLLVFLFTETTPPSSFRNNEVIVALQHANKSYGRQALIPIYVGKLNYKIPSGIEKIQGISIGTNDDTSVLGKKIYEISNTIAKNDYSYKKSDRQKFLFIKLMRLLSPKMKILFVILLIILAYFFGARGYRFFYDFVVNFLINK